MFGWFTSRWRQVRWRLAVCYFLIGGVSLLLLSALAISVGIVLIEHATVYMVERQVALAVESLARDPAPPGGQSMPPPPWLQEDTFTGIVSDGGRPFLRTYRKGVAHDLPIDESFAKMLERASEVEIETAGPRPGSPGTKRRDGEASVRSKGRRKGPPAQWEILWRRIFGTEGPGAAGFVPVFVPVRDWKSGRVTERAVLRVQPDFRVKLRQLAHHGERRALWIWVLNVLGGAFLVVELVALAFAFRLTREIITSVEELSRGAKEIGAGNLKHRVPVARRDQLGEVASLFNEMAASLERLLQETKEKERLEQEIRVARNVQESLYPRSLPRLPGTGLAAFCQPARLVSGDLYDAIELSPTRLGLLCADVSGKGIPAAILTATVHAVARALADKGAAPKPSELVSAMNAELCQRIPDNSFVTVFWADFDAVSRVLRYTNAGHNPPFLIPPNGEEVIRLEEGGVPVGFFKDAVFEESELRLTPGSLLVIFTDGVPEAQNAAGEEFGEDRLLELCRMHAAEKPDILVEKVRQALKEWTEGAPQFDDTTLLALKA